MTVVYLILLYFVCIILGRRFDKKNITILLFLVPFMIFAVVTRPDTLPDITGYTQVIQYNLDNRWEPSFNLICKIGYIVGNPVTTVFLIYASISIIGRVYYLKKMSPYFWGSMIVYSSYYYIYNDMIQMRAAVATMLLLPIIIAAKERKIGPYILLVILATLFHFSAVVFIFIYFLNANNINKKTWIGAIVVSFVLVIAGIYLTPLINYIGWGPVHSLFVHYYEDSDIEEFVNIYSILHVGQVLCAIFLLFKVDRIKDVSPYFILALKIFVIGLCIKTIFSDLPIVANRSSELFTSIEIFLIPSAFLALCKKRELCYILTVLYSMIFFVYSLKTWF